MGLVCGSAPSARGKARVACALAVSAGGATGVLFSDPTGAITVKGVYWANEQTGVVADTPIEARVDPQKWNELDPLVK